jgi:hypothetical protein
MVRDTVDCGWEVVEGVLGSIGGTAAGRLKFFKFLTVGKKISTQRSISAI